MEKEKIDRILSDIFRRLMQQHIPSEEQKEMVLSYALECLCDLNCEHSDEYDTLKEYVTRISEYGLQDIADCESTFEYGWLYAIFSLLEMAEEQSSMAEHNEIRKKKYGKYSQLFYLIDNHPGMRHKEIAERLGKSPSELSQILYNMREEHFFSYIKVGREKFYYIEDAGRRFLKLLQREETCCTVELKAVPSQVSSGSIRENQMNFGSFCTVSTANVGKEPVERTLRELYYPFNRQNEENSNINNIFKRNGEMFWQDFLLQEEEEERNDRRQDYRRYQKPVKMGGHL